MNIPGIKTIRNRPAVSFFKLAGFCCVILAGLVFYISNATKSGLWADEATEYFFSKYMTGTVPGGAGTVNMFERIRFTYQPPLYNVLMFFWLKIFDSEFGFRLAGIVFTMAGAAGIFLAVEETVKEGVWSVLAAAVFIFTDGTINYGLECAEYNLMLCFMAWTTYFFLRFLKRKDLRSMTGFFVFACLAVYSQYGAAFMAFGMYIALFAQLIKEKNAKGIKHFLLLSAVTLALAVLPLLLLFTIPQMKNQGSMSIGHGMFFARGFIKDFFSGFADVLTWLFGKEWLCAALILLAICAVTAFFKHKKTAFPVLALLVSWVLYFFAVSCSFYGYNNWKPESVGTMNLGGKYSLFFIPLLVVLMISGVGLIVNRIKGRGCLLSIVLTAAAAASASFFCFVQSYKINHSGLEIKDNCREIVSLWYERGAYDSKTIAYPLEYEPFVYYLMNDDRYVESYFDSVECEDEWIRTAEPDEIAGNLKQDGYLDLDEFYYVTTFYGNHENFITAVTNEGYDAEILYSGSSVFIRVTRQK